MMHWRQLSTPEKIEAIKECWEPDMSASEIAANFDGATRNAVIGMYDRHGAALTGFPLRKPVSRQRPARNPKPKPALAFKQASPRNVDWGNVAAAKPKCQTIRCEPIGEPHTVGRPLGDLPARRCKFAVTPHDAESHLFCGMPAEGSYCEFHRGIVYQPKSALNERRNAA